MKLHWVVLLAIAVIVGGAFPRGTPATNTNVIANGSAQFWFNGAPTVVVNNIDQRFWFNGAPNSGPIQ